MKRGDIVTAVISGDYGKPRPALIVQSDLFDATASLTLLLITGTLQNANLLRVQVEPSDANGLRKPSQIMIDRMMTVPRTRVGQVVGKLDGETLRVVEGNLTAFLGLLH